MDINLKIDPEFQSKIPPLTEAEYKQLEENILSAGEIYEPIVTWNGIIVDGHNRYKIAQSHPGIPYKTRQMDFADKWEAFDWMYKNQLGRRNLTDEQRTYLLGKLYEARKHTNKFKGNQYVDESGGRQNDAEQKGRVREQIMEEQGVGQKTVERAEHYAHGIDAIRAEDPELAEEILQGKKSVTKTSVMAVAKADDTEKADAINAVRNYKRPSPSPEKKCDRTSGKEIREIIGSMSDESAMEYTIDHLTEQVRVNAESFIRMLNNLLNDHSDLCDENSELILKVICETVTEPIEKMIKEKLNNET